MTAIGFDPVSGHIVISENGVYGAGTLTAAMLGDGHVQITSLAGRGELFMPWAGLTDLQGNAFTAPSEALAYLQGEFAKRQAVGETFGVATVAGADLSQGMPVAISRATGQLLPAQADTYALAFVAGLASVDTAQGFTDQPAHGAVSLSDWTAIAGTALLTPGTPYFLAPAGGLSTAAVCPGSTCVTRVGFAASVTTLVVQPSPPILL